MNYRYIKALGLNNDNISLAYDVITKKDGMEWMKSCNIAVEHITNGFVFELMKQYRSMGYDVPFLPEHGTRSVEKNYTMFKEFIALTMKVHISNKLTSTRTNLPWFNRGLKRMCKVKRRRFMRAKKSKKARDWERYVAHKKATASALKAAR